MLFVVELDDEELQNDADAETVQEMADLVRLCLERKFMTVKIKAPGGVESHSKAGMRMKDRGSIFGFIFGD